MKRFRIGASKTGKDPRLRVLDLDGCVLLAEARRRTRLEDVAEDETFREAFGLLIRSYETEASLNLVGRIAARYDTIRLLMNRLRLVDDRKRRPEIATQEIRKPVFLTGLPRSGTLLHGLLACDPDNRVPLYWETILSSPPPERISHATDPRIVAAKREVLWLQRLRPGGRGLHRLGAQLPQECATIMNPCFVSFDFQATYHVPTYQAWLETGDLVYSYAWHRRFLQHLQSRCQGARWVLSAPAHLFGLPALFATYPDATVVFVHRDPVDASESLAKLTVVLRSAFGDAVDPVEVGRETTERWATAVDLACRYRDTAVIPAGRFVDVRHEDLLHDPIGTVRRLYARCDIPLENAVAQRMRQFAEASATDAQDPCGDSQPELGLAAEWIRERYRSYRERFGV